MYPDNFSSPASPTAQLASAVIRSVRGSRSIADPPQADDEFEKPYLAGFEWDPEDCYTRFIVHQSAQPTSSMSGGSGGKKKKKNAAIAEEGS
jgi:hypothetical protein